MNLISLVMSLGLAGSYVVVAQFPYIDGRMDRAIYYMVVAVFWALLAILTQLHRERAE